MENNIDAIVIEENVNRKLVMYNLKKDSFKNDFKNLQQHTKSYIDSKKQEVTTCGFYKNILLRRLPIIKWLFLEYKIKDYLQADLIAGFTVGIMTLPQSMAYAILANLMPVIGLYMAFFPLIIYAIFGTSKQILIGAVSIISLFTGEVVRDLAADYNQTLIVNNVTFNESIPLINDYKQNVACSLALFIGFIQLIMGFTGLGVLTTYFSDSFISSYMCGSAVHVFASQVKDLFGLNGLTRFNGALKIPKTFIDIIMKIKTANVTTTLTSAICIVYLIIFKEYFNQKIKRRVKVEFPFELILVIGVTVISFYMQLNAEYGVDIVKTIPQGFPKPSVPNINLWYKFIKSGLIIAFLAFSSNISLAKTFAQKNKYSIESTQELYAYGLTNIFISFFSCFPTSASLSRSMVLDNVGGKTQIGSVFSSFLIVIVILWLGKFLEDLPNACLASIIVVALKGLLFQIKDFPKYWRINKFEGLTWLITFASVILLDVDWGLLVGIVSSIFLVIVKDQCFSFHHFNRNPTTKTYFDKNLLKLEYGDSDNVKLFKVQSSLYFVNIEKFSKQLIELCQIDSSFGRISKSGYESDTSIQQNQLTKQNSDIFSVKFVLLDFSAVNYVDSMAIKNILEVITRLRTQGVEVYICNITDCFIRLINNMDLCDNFSSFLFVTTEDAYQEAQKQYNLQNTKVNTTP